MPNRLLARTLAGLGLCIATLSASAAPAYSSLVVFGDSLSDSGNNALLIGTAPGQVITGDDYYARIPYASGTYSNGPVWTQYLAQSLGLPLAPSLAGGGNFAFGGAQTGANGSDIPAIPGFPFSMRTQLDGYLSATGHVADPNALYIVSGGGNNVRVALDAVAGGADIGTTFTSTVAGYASDMAGLVGDLRAAGAQHVLVLDTPNFGLTPLARAAGADVLATQLSFAMDQALANALAGSGATTFDMFGYLTAAVGSGAGYSDVLHACGAAVNNCDPNTSLFYDAIHPTTLGHQQLAAAVFTAAAVPEPDAAALLAAGLAALALVRRRRAGLQHR